MPGGFVCSASLRGAPRKTDIRATVADGLPVRKLFSREQRAFYAAHAPEGIGLDDLTVLGPIFILKARLTPKELDRRRLVAEMWLYPDGSRLLELSTKCLPAEAFQFAAEVRAYLAERGVDISGEQQTKTKKALEYFAGIAGGGRLQTQIGADEPPVPRGRPISIRSGVPRWLPNAPGWRGGAPRWAPPPGRSPWAGSPPNCSTSPPGRTSCSAAATRLSRSGC